MYFAHAPYGIVEFADDGCVAEVREAVEGVAISVFRVVVVGVVANLDVGVGDGVFDEADLGKSVHGVL